MEKQAVITATDLCIGYRTHKGEKKVHEHLSFGLYPGELTSLLGANGAGKSTLLRTLSASQPSLAGELQLLGKPLQQYSEKERSRTIGVVLTDKTQAGGLTVYELVALGRQPHTGFFGRLHPKDHLIIKEALDAVGIAHKAESYTAELSDGERQKVMIAKALVQECPLIILDEPTAFLDVVSRIEIMTLLHQLAVEQNKAILLSTHDIEQALVLSDKLWLLSKETGLQCGVTEDMILNHRMDTLFSHSEWKAGNNGGSDRRNLIALDYQRTEPSRIYLSANPKRSCRSAPSTSHRSRCLVPHPGRETTDIHFVREVAGRNKIKTRINHSGLRAVSLCKSTM